VTARRRAKARRDPRGLVDALEAREAQALLGRLLDARPELVEEAAALASHDLGAVRVKRVAGEVARAVGALRIEDVWSHSGPQRDGSYVEPTEATWIVLEAAINPFLRDLERRIELRREPEALAICQGALLGLYRVEQAAGDDFLEGHAPDDLRGAASFVVETWKRGRGRASPRGSLDRDPMRAFSREALPEWESFLIRVLGRAPKRRA
jgi:hypothetical protein